MIRCVKRSIHDEMVYKCKIYMNVYTQPLESFDSGNVCEPVHTVNLLGEGSKALRDLNESRGLGFDDWDIDYYSRMVSLCVLHVISFA